MLVTMPKGAGVDALQNQRRELAYQLMELGKQVQKARNEGNEKLEAEIDEKRDAINEQIKELNKQSKSKSPKFKSSHFDEPNILVHLRMNTRTDADATRFCFWKKCKAIGVRQGRRKGLMAKKQRTQRLYL